MTPEFIIHILKESFSSIKEFYYFKEYYNVKKFAKLLNGFIQNQKTFIKDLSDKYNVPAPAVHDNIIDFLESYQAMVSKVFDLNKN